MRTWPCSSSRMLAGCRDQRTQGHRDLDQDQSQSQDQDQDQDLDLDQDQDHHEAVVHVLQAQDDLGCVEPHLLLTEDAVLGQVVVEVPAWTHGQAHTPQGAVHLTEASTADDPMNAEVIHGRDDDEEAPPLNLFLPHLSMNFRKIFPRRLSQISTMYGCNNNNVSEDTRQGCCCGGKQQQQQQRRPVSSVDRLIVGVSPPQGAAVPKPSAVVSLN
ncbi:hypothetical protein EYF80_063871 [Liparis tanakae]|uniref:Uncharacterized protein n=1 Tax=Liparis tanakae TaxID=230148 RepID=A0A4Z2EB94_9TELE|nr:hypothetical protein EYF80_063871 [Liparis tanakae]